MNDPYEPPDDNGLPDVLDFMEDPHGKHIKREIPEDPKLPLDDRLIRDWNTMELIHEMDTLAPPWERHNPEGGRYEELMDDLERSIESNRQERDRIAHPPEPLDINFPDPEPSIMGGPRNSDPPSPIEPLTSPTRGPNPPGSRKPVLKTRSGAFGGSGRFRPRVKKFNFKSKYVPGLEKYRCPDGRGIVTWLDDCRNCDHYRSTTYPPPHCYLLITKGEPESADEEQVAYHRMFMEDPANIKKRWLERQIEKYGLDWEFVKPVK